MQSRKIDNPLIVIVGPTAVGKTEWAITLAQHLNGEIISSDSRLFYRGMDIGTAKPSLVERSQVPHHLVDICEPDESYSLTQFQQAVQETIQALQERGKLPFLVGGTGQYVHAVTEGWTPPRQQPDEALRIILARWAEEIGNQELHRRLSLLDPQAAEAIDYRNVRRTIRALEVIFSTGVKLSQQRGREGCRYSLIQIGFSRPRPILYQRIDERIEQMIQLGLVEEVRCLLAKGYGSSLPSMSAIGYREVVAYIKGEISLDEAILLMKRYTRQFVRRQANWFKEIDPAIRWFDLEQATLEEVESYILSCL